MPLNLQLNRKNILPSFLPSYQPSYLFLYLSWIPMRYLERTFQWMTCMFTDGKRCIFGQACNFPPHSFPRQEMLTKRWRKLKQTTKIAISEFDRKRSTITFSKDFGFWYSLQRLCGDSYGLHTKWNSWVLTIYANHPDGNFRYKYEMS